MFDLSKREITGISVEKDTVRMATLAISKEKVTVVGLQKFKLAGPLVKAQEANEEIDTDELLNPSESADDEAFGLEDSDALSAALNDDINEDWDMADAGSADAFDDNSNATRLANAFREMLTKSITTSLSIPFEQTYLQSVSDIDLKKNSKGKIRKELHARLDALYGHPVSEDQVCWVRHSDEKSLLVASIDRNVPLVTLVDETLPLFDGKINVRSVQSEEMLLLGLIRTNYELLDHEYSCIVHVEDSSTHVIFLKGKEFHSILPVIKEGSRTGRVARTIFSKILFEVDRGKIPTLDRIIITGDTLEGKLLTFLSDQFIDVAVTPFEYDGDKFDVDATLSDDYRDYLKSIACAWAATGHPKADFVDLNFLPKYVQTRQQVFKLEWHGFLLLLLIALTPIIFNNQFQQRKAELVEQEQLIQRLDQQISETRAIAQVVDRLSAEFGQYQTAVALLDTLSHNTLKWSRTLQIVNNATENINGVWFTSFQGSEGNLVIQGTSLYRDRIPRISNTFHDATLQQVTEREDRGIIMYDFVILVSEIVGDKSVFRPEKNRAPENLIELREGGDARGVIDF